MTRMLVPAVAAAAALGVLSGCGEDQSSDPVSKAQTKVTAKEKALSDAQGELTKASAAFCDASKEYVVALDRYGDVLTQTAPTVGDVTEAGSDLAAPRDDVSGAADDAVAAQEGVAAAERELAQAKADLEAARNSTSPSAVDTASMSPSPLAPQASVDRVKRAESDFASARSGISAQTPLTDASQAFNAAAVALEMSWLRLFADAGCLTDDQQARAAGAVGDYTTTLQSSLKTAGYYDGAVDGVYGPETVAAVKALQEAHDLPVTGTVDRATSAALDSDVLAAGGDQAQQQLTSTAALQTTLKLAGFWDGPVDGSWTPELTTALEKFQTELGVKPTGTVDPATMSAFEKALAKAQKAATSATAPPAPGNAGSPRASLPVVTPTTR